jgi:hypothetical protein
VQPIQTGICSNALVVETRNILGQRTPVTNTTIVTFTATGSGATGVSFFSDAQCLTAPNPVTQIPAGQSSASLYFRASLAGTPVFTASSPPLMAATQTQNVSNPPNQLVYVTNPPPLPILAGQCFLATVESRFNGTVAPVLNTSTVSLQAGPIDSLRFFSNTTCTTSISSVNIPAGSSRASFYIKTISGGPDVATAIAPFGTAQLMFTVQGVVRKGSCVMSSLQSTVNCPVSPPQISLGKTMLMYQATSSADQPLPSEIKCRLNTVDTVVCERDIGISGGGSSGTILWQTAELVSGLNVQRAYPPTCLPSISLSPPIDPNSSFVLSSFSGVGTNYDGDDLTAMRLDADGGTVFVDNRGSQACSGYEMQAIELSGVSTIRGSAPGLLPGQRTANLVVTPPASPNSVVFNQTLLAGAIPTSTPLCALMVRASIDTPTSLVFSRANSSINTSCITVGLTELVYERVDFGSRGRVQTFTLDLQNNSQDVVISQVDTTRTLVFAGGQAAGGQASGETDYNNQGSGSLGVGTARFDLLSPTTVRVTRGRSSGDATVMMYVLELEP